MNIESNLADEQSVSNIVSANKIFAEQVRILYDYAPPLFLLQFFFASFVAIGMSHPLGQKVAFWGWLILVVGLVVAFFSYVGYKSSQDAYDKPRLWYALLLLTGAFLSLIWSAVFVYMLEHLDKLEYQALVVAMLAVVMGCGIAMLAMRVLMLVLCNICLVSAPIVWLSLRDSTFYYLMAAILFLLSIAICYFGWLYARRTTNGLRWQMLNSSLQEAVKIRDNQLNALNKQLKQMSATDALTQVANRRYFEDRYQSEWRRIAREQDEMAVLLIDIDHFGDYNAHFGHQAGDLCIARIALCVRDSLRRPADIVARLSGNVFVVLLPNTPATGAMRVAQMIRESVVQQEIANPSEANPERMLTVSIGAAHAQVREDMPRSGLIATAEEALFSSQQERNKVTFKTMCKQ